MESHLESKNIKYPKSISNDQCIGPCYEAGSVIIHPVTLDEFTNAGHNFCPVDSFVTSNPETGERTIKQIDLCYIPTVTQKDMSKFSDVLRQQLIAPTFKFSTNHFLRIYYNIGSLEEGIEWLEKNETSPYRTKERVFNQLMMLYGDNLSIADHRMVKFIREIMIYNLPLIFRAVSKYIEIRDDKIVLTLPENRQHEEGKVNKSQIALINSYVKTKFLGESEIGRFISKFLRYGVEYLKKPNFSKILVDNMIDYIIQRIRVTLNN